LDSERHKSLTATKPWLKANPPISRSTWFRRQKEGK